MPRPGAGEHEPALRPFRRHEVPRAGGAPRSLVRLDVADDATYRRLLSPLVPAIEASLGTGVIASRARPDRSGSVEDWRLARRRWVRTVEAALAAEPGGTLVVADVADCYRAIRPWAVEQALRGISGDRVEIPPLIDLVRVLDEAAGPGLPVGPDPSAIVANAVLAGADRALALDHGPAVRWIDDVVIVRGSRRSAIAALDRWRRAIEALGLSENRRKLRVAQVRDARSALRGLPSDVG